MADRIPLVIEGTQIREITNGDRLDIGGNALQVGGNITPDTDSAYDIGTSSLKFRDIYLSAGTIHLGGVKLKADGNSLTIQDSTGAASGITAASLGQISTDNLSEGSSNLFTTAARTRSHINVVDAGGNGSFAYDSALGKLTYTGVSDATIRGLFSGSSGISYNSGTGAITINSADSVTFSGLTVAGDLTVTGTTTSIDTIAYTVNDPLIHLADSNEVSDVVDIGFIGHYYRDGARRHAGLFRNADDQSFNLFNNMVDSAFDSSAPPNVINTGATGYTLANLNAGTITATFSGNVTGNVTGNADTATALASGQNFSLTGDVTAGAISFDGTGAVALSTTIAAGAVSSTELASASTLTIKNTAGTTLKTVIGAGS